MTRRLALSFAVAGLGTRAPLPAADFELRLDKLADAFLLLSQADRAEIDRVVTLVRQGEHGEALRRLAALNGANPENSSLRVLTAYALLRAGNLVGALDEARKAHGAGNGNAYRCWFYSKIAFLYGDIQTCERELQHARESGELPAEVRALEAELKKRKR